MSTQENGQAALVNRPTFGVIVSTSNTDPIEVTSFAPHLMTTGDTVWVRGANDGNANGVWPVIVTGADTFELVGSTNDGGGGAAGLFMSLGFDSTFAIPSDGDPADAASVDVSLEALADRTAWLASKIGAFLYPFYQQFAFRDNDAGTSWSSNTIVSTSYILIDSSPSLIFDGVEITDEFEVEFESSFASVSAPAGASNIALGYTVNGGAVTKIPGSSLNVYNLGASVTITLPINLIGEVNGLAGTIEFGVIAKTASGSWTLTFGGDYTFKVRQLRAV